MKSKWTRNRRKGWAAAFVCMLTVLLAAGVCSAYPAYAALDASASTDLTVTAAVSGQAVSGLRVTLYKAADMQVSSNGELSFSVTDAFARYDDVDASFDPNNYNSSEWAQAAANLDPHVRSDAQAGTAPAFETYSQVTGTDGTASFTGIRQGLYLMTGSYEGSDYASATVTPAFLTVPQWSEDTSSWVYDAKATVKLRVSAKTQETETTSLTVRKAWSGDSSATNLRKRPASVTVQLLNAAGNTVSEATLSAANGWAYTWTGLSTGSWSVKEDSIPSGYSVSYSEQETSAGKTVTVTNTLSSDGVLGESREKTDESETESSKKKGGQVRGTSRETDSGVAGESRLPQTGQLWWPVWLLSGIAAVLVILGLALRHSGKKDLKDR